MKPDTTANAVVRKGVKAPASWHLIHGTTDGYDNHRCRCALCRTAATERQAASLLARAAALGPCSVETCDRGQYAKGYCRPHYDRAKRGADLTPPIPESTVRFDELRCQSCQAWLPDSCFHHNAKEAHRRGRHGTCIECNAVFRREYRNKHRVPCDDGCGRKVEGKGRANTKAAKGGGRVQLDPNRPFLCNSCQHARYKAERRAA